VLLARTTLIMLFIAALVLLALGAAALILPDTPEVDGWLRYIFGRVFRGHGDRPRGSAGDPVRRRPVGDGRCARARCRTGARRDARAGFSRAWAAVTIAVTAVVLLVTGSAATILNLGLLGIVGLASFGLAGATSFSPHRARAILSGVALVLVALGSLWVLVNAFVRPPVGV
jgi:hypothetical protein